MVTNYELLSDAQEYLKDQISGIAPNSELLNSWDEFFAIYDAIIRRFAVAVGVPADEVDECVQDVWTAVVAHLNRFQPDPERGRFRTWLYHIVRSKSTDLVRRRARGVALSLNDSRYEFDVAGASHEGDSPTLEQRWQQQSLRVLLADLRKQVSPTSYQVFELRAVRGGTFEQLSRQLGMKPSTVRTRYHRTLKRFRDLRRRYTGTGE